MTSIAAFFLVNGRQPFSSHLKKSISTRFQVCAAPKSWSKYTTSCLETCWTCLVLLKYDRRHFYSLFFIFVLVSISNKMTFGQIFTPSPFPMKYQFTVEIYAVILLAVLPPACVTYSISMCKMYADKKSRLLTMKYTPQVSSV